MSKHMVINQDYFIDISEGANIHEISSILSQLTSCKYMKSVIINRSLGPFSLPFEQFFRILSFETSSEFILIDRNLSYTNDKISLIRIAKQNADHEAAIDKCEIDFATVITATGYLDEAIVFPAEWNILKCEDYSVNGTEILNLRDLYRSINSRYVVFSLCQLNVEFVSMIKDSIANGMLNKIPQQYIVENAGRTEVVLFALATDTLAQLNFLSREYQSLYGLKKRLSATCRIYNIPTNINYLFNTVKKISVHTKFCEYLEDRYVKPAYCTSQVYSVRTVSNSFHSLDKLCQRISNSHSPIINIVVDKKNLLLLPLLLKRLADICPLKFIKIVTSSRCLYLELLDITGNQANSYLVSCGDQNSYELTLQPRYKKPVSDSNSWTFGVITDGRSPNKIYEHISSIQATKVPHYEIIICGPHFGVLPSNCRLLNLSETERSSDIRAWITKKKNLIIENASYENCIICHDRITFDSKWHEEVKKYHQNFDILVFPVRGKDNDKYRVNDWERYHGTYLDFRTFKLTPMNYDEWHPNAMIYGGAFAVKRSLYLRLPLDERLHWSEAEDVLQSELHTLNGYIVELVSNAILYSDRSRLGGYRDTFVIRKLVCAFRYVVSGRIKLFCLFLKNGLIYGVRKGYWR